MDNRLHYATHPDQRFLSLLGLAGCFLFIAGAVFTGFKMISREGLSNLDCFRSCAMFFCGSVCGWFGRRRHRNTRGLDRIALKINLVPFFGCGLLLIIIYVLLPG